MRVRLAVYSSFAVKWLIPRLAGLRQLYPELDLSLEMVAKTPSSPTGWRTVSSPSPRRAGLHARSALSGAADAGVQSPDVAAGGRGRAAALWQLPLLSIQAIYREKGKIGGVGPKWGADHSPRRGCTISAISCWRWRRRTGTRGWRSSTTTCCSRKIRVWCGCPCTPRDRRQLLFRLQALAAHEPAISRLRQWLWQESQASLRPGENEPLRRV